MFKQIILILLILIQSVYALSTSCTGYVVPGPYAYRSRGLNKPSVDPDRELRIKKFTTAKGYKVVIIYSSALQPYVDQLKCPN